MASDNWEADLRKELHVKTVEPAPRDWEDRLAEDVRPLEPLPEKRSGSGTLVFLVLLAVLGVGLLFAYDYKTGGGLSSWFSSSLRSDNDPDLGPRPAVTHAGDADLAALRADIRRVEAQNKSEIEKLAKRTQYNSDRLTLIGLMLNENFMIVRNNHDKGHLIFFNRDWTLDQMPHYIELSDEDKEYLKKFVKPAQ